MNKLFTFDNVIQFILVLYWFAMMIIGLFKGYEVNLHIFNCTMFLFQSTWLRLNLQNS